MVRPTDTMRPTTMLMLQKGSSFSTIGFPYVAMPLLARYENIRHLLRSILGLVKRANKMIDAVLQPVNRFHFLLFFLQRTDKVVNAIFIFLEHDLQGLILSAELRR